MSKSWALPELLHGTWGIRALCRRHPELPWTADTKPSNTELWEMTDVCAECPVSRECAVYAVDAKNWPKIGGFYAGRWIPWNLMNGDVAIGRTIARNVLRRRIAETPLSEGER